MAVDGGQVYTAGKCGLVPAMVEQYSAGMRPTETIPYNPVFELLHMNNIWISVSLSLSTDLCRNPGGKIKCLNIDIINIEVYLITK